MTEEKKKKGITKGDLFLLLGVLLFCGVFWAGVHFLSGKGNTAVVSVDGKEVARFSLGEDREETIEVPGGKNVIRIRDGEASVSFADCPDRICQKHLPVSTTGETIICLPHKLVVEIRSK